MKLFLLGFVFAFVRAEIKEIDPQLNGGALALGGEFPSAVFIRSPGTPNQPLCGGTIIDRNHVT
jgi:hypothetical protein